MVGSRARAAWSRPRAAAWAAALGAAILGVWACAAPRGTIGAMLGRRAGGELTIRDVPPGLAADSAGLQPGDRILLIEGVDARTLDAAELHALLGGPVGTRVSLTVERGREVLRLKVLRTPPPSRRQQPK